MKHDLQQFIGWKLDETRVWWEKQDANCVLHITEIAPPAKPPRRETAKSKRAPQSDEMAQPRERNGDWRVLRCRYANETDGDRAASTCRTIEIVAAREILRND